MPFFLKNILLVGVVVWLPLISLSKAQGACDLLKKFPHTNTFKLTNGRSVPTPTHSENFDTYTVYGFLDFLQTSRHLSQENVIPMKAAGHALGALSVYDYKSSDVGPFKEAYFVILVYGKGLKEISLYHEKVWSSTQTAMLMSKELWGIPSEKAQIENSSDPEGKHFFVYSKGNSIFEMAWRDSFNISNPIAQDLRVFAVGPPLDSQQKWSPVEACRRTRLGPFVRWRGDNIIIYDETIKNLLQNLNFKPFMKEIGFSGQAVQFLPQ